MISRYGCLMLAVLFLTVSGALADEAQPHKPGAGDKCPVCGMFVAKYPDFLAQITFQDGSYTFFDGVKDMMKYYVGLAQYNPSKKPGDIAAVWVTDYYSLTMIDGFKAHYVIGSKVYGPMGKELVPFKGEAEAREFKNDHGGQAIISFSGINEKLLKTLD